jgi:hypothetical protein
MMKKEYSKPEVQIIELRQQQLLQVTSQLEIYDDEVEDEGLVM